MLKSKLRIQWLKHIHTQLAFNKPGIQPLTDITVVARPASNAVAIVAANQVPAGVGIDTGLALTFIRIWKNKVDGQMQSL